MQTGIGINEVMNQAMVRNEQAMQYQIRSRINVRDKGKLNRLSNSTEQDPNTCRTKVRKQGTLRRPVSIATVLANFLNRLSGANTKFGHTHTSAHKL